MRRRPHLADVVAFLILAVLVGVLGSGLGVAAAHIRSSGSGDHGPLRVILPERGDAGERRAVAPARPHPAAAALGARANPA